MLIVEDVLLLLLDDQRGTVSGAGTVEYTLAGAVLMDLALADRARIEPSTSAWRSSKVHAVPGAPMGDALLDEALATLAEKPRTAYEVVYKLGNGLQKQVADRLVERGLVRREQKRVLGLFRETRWPAADARHETELRRVLERVLVHDEDPDPRTGAIIAVLAASYQVHQVLRFPGSSWTAVEKRAQAISKGEWAAEAVRTAIVAMMASITAVTTGGAATAATS